MFHNMQLRELYEINDDVKRKEFLDELADFMLRRGTPINRLPVMAKQTLDLYELYKLVCQRGGVLEVINKKLWQDVIKGLNIPTSITSAAFTLRNQYLKILYPFECEKRNFSRPEELEAIVNGNKRPISVKAFDNYLGEPLPLRDHQTSIFDQPPVFNGFDKIPMSSLQSRLQNPFGSPFGALNQSPVSSLQNPSPLFGGFDQQPSPLASLITQQSLLMRYMKMMEDQQSEPEPKESNTEPNHEAFIPMVTINSELDTTPIRIKREREDDDTEEHIPKKYMPENLLTPPTSNRSEQEEEPSPKRSEETTPDVTVFGGMQFDLKRDENGQLRISLSLNGVKYEGALNVVS